MRLIARAMLRAQWAAAQVSYIGLFTPFIIAAIAKDGRRVATFAETKATLMDEFVFDVPESVIHTVLKQAIRQGYGEWERVGTGRRSNAFRLAPDKALPDLAARRADAEREQRALVSDLRGFAESQLGVGLDDEQAASMLADFVECNVVGIIGGIRRTNGDTPDFDPSTVVGRWIEHVIAERPVETGYLQNIVIGVMLTAALHVDDIGQLERRFDGLEIVLDAPTILDALGHNGEPAQIAAREGLDLLKATGARLACWEHTVDELGGVLRNAARALDGKAPEDGFVSQVEIEAARRGRTGGAMMEASLSVREQVTRLGITVRETPSHRADLTLDETAALEFMMEPFPTERKRQAQYDIDSFTAVYRARGGRPLRRLESGGYILATTNHRLCALGRELLPNRPGFPVAISIHELTTLAWLKQPRKAPNLSILQLAADAYAAARPREELVSRAIAEATKLRKTGEVDDVDLGRVRYEAETQAILVRHTGGRPERATAETVMSALQERKDAETQALRTAAQAKRDRDGLIERVEALEREAEAERAQLAGKLSAAQDANEEVTGENERLQSTVRRLTAVIAWTGAVMFAATAAAIAYTIGGALGLLIAAVPAGFAIFIVHEWGGVGRRVKLLASIIVVLVGLTAGLIQALDSPSNSKAPTQRPPTSTRP